MAKFKSQFITGALVGVGLTTAGIYLYKKNQVKIDTFLRSQGVNIPTKKDKDYSSMTLEELTLSKEKIEDLVAEKELVKSGK
ncbi:MAG: hypothetical protein GY756_26705 [bacterium]|nr:hypothetical protein [bacterium]